VQHSMLINTHLKLLLHLFSKFMSLRVNCCPTDDIIYIYLGNKLVLTLVPNEQSSVSMTSTKSLSKEIISKTIIPFTRSLLETIQGLFQLVHMLRMMGILKSLGLCYIDIFLKYAIQEGTFDIHLIEIESKMADNG
jgi:hypothetical protein